MNPVIHENLIEEFWLSASVDKEADSKSGAITAQVQNTGTVITEDVIRDVLTFLDKSTDPVSVQKEVIQNVLNNMGYEGVYPMLQKKQLTPYWRYIAHVFMVCMSGNKTFDMLNKDQASAFVSLAMNWNFNYSKYILEEMKGNLKGKKAEIFMMYPRFLQMIFDEKFSGLERGVVTRDLKMLNESTFPLMLQNREGKYIFRGIHPLRKFGQFAEKEEVVVDEPVALNVIFHDDEDIAIEPEIETVFDVETKIAEHQVQIDMQQDLFNSKNLTALLMSVQRRVKILPSTSSLDKQDEVMDVGADLAPRKRRRRDPRPGAIVSNSQIPQVQTDTSITAEPTQIEKEQTGPSIEILDYDTYLTGEQGTKLRTNNAQKDVKIKSLEIDVGHLTAIVIDLKHKLQEKFQGEFTDESSPNTISASTSTKELTQAEKDNISLSHEEGLRIYFARETGLKVSTKRFRELLIMKEKRSQAEKDARKIKPTRFQVDVEHSTYNLEGDRTGIVCWGYDALKEMWWIHRKFSRRIEYYSHALNFQCFTMVVQIELAGKNFFNPMKIQRGENFYSSLQQYVRSGFSDTKLAKSMRVKKKYNSLGNPLDINLFEVKWPPTERVKRIPILSDLPEGSHEDFKFWAFYPKAYGVLINCGEQEYSFYDPVDLMCFSEKEKVY
ncbi:hypothetical protein R6Q57_015996 [Mikania cordata]